MNPDKRREKKLGGRKVAQNSDRRSQPKDRPAASLKVTRTQEFNLFDEVAYIIRRAEDGESRVVVMGDFVLFSTSTGDAWLLDSEDNFATCLLLGQKPQACRIAEIPTSYAVEWQMQYAFDGDRFVLTDGQGQNFVLAGYPLSEIQQAISEHVRLAQELDP